MSQFPNTDIEGKSLSDKTKTQMEEQDTSWQQIRGMLLLIGAVLLGSHLYKKYKSSK
jgi:hypothetical protein